MQMRNLIRRGALRHLVGWALAIGFLYVAYRAWRAEHSEMPVYLTDGYGYVLSFPFLALGFACRAGADLGRSFQLATMRSRTARQQASSFGARGLMLLASIFVSPTEPALVLVVVFGVVAIWSPLPTPVSQDGPEEPR